ncbi:hypothetical protein KSP39_PZI019765 [Platanthera zijinensis]|uniref:Translocation protein SEC62 n=1 Tax=Platanthera zijinensis TaxID=2320716 RepID=A0AAP0FY75_9ASPA
MSCLQKLFWAFLLVEFEFDCTQSGGPIWIRIHSPCYSFKKNSGNLVFVWHGGLKFSVAHAKTLFGASLSHKHRQTAKSARAQLDNPCLKLIYHHLLHDILLCMDAMEQIFSKEDAFFAWTFMKRRALWQTILSFLWPLVALAMCLFPVYPYQVKIVVLYSCAGALLFIVAMLLSKFENCNLFLQVGPQQPPILRTSGANDWDSTGRGPVNTSGFLVALKTQVNRGPMATRNNDVGKGKG